MEALWHVRAGLNVAALSCPSLTGTAIVSDYNSFLKAQHAPLANSYQQVSQRYEMRGGNWQQHFDADMTRLYNHFAAPDAQRGFCRQAASEVKRAIAAPDNGEPTWAVDMLARLDQPFQMAPAASVRSYGIQPLMAAPAQATPVAPMSAQFNWRIQLGAFGSKANAERAWNRIRSRNSEIARMAVHYEPVPGKSLTRLQVRNVQSKAHAIQLCAQASAAGFDCFPVRHN